ncbi:MAG: ABC transporter permease [Candidatus Zixiibacteriota bacterium]|nr:MAG: ABC transporter permease [candidate division Zixibacteria bacterium]
MITGYLKVTVRNIVRRKGYLSINIAGLAIGMTVAILMLLWVQHELSYDRFHRNSENLYRVAIENKLGDHVSHNAVCPAPLAPALKADFPEITHATRYGWSRWVLAYHDKRFNENGVVFADPDFLEMFTFPLVKGDPVSALSEPRSILLTEAMAEKYFGEEDPLGEIFRVNDKHDFKITGVLKNIPGNSSLRFDFIAPFEYLREREDIDYWGAHRYYEYVMLHEQISARQVDNKIAGIFEKHGQGSNNRPYLQPLKDMHLYSRLNYDNPRRGDSKYIWIFSALAVFVLVIACINFMNLTTARSMMRVREVGMRKAIGANQMQLVKQFFGESVFLALLAFMLAMIVVEVMLPVLNNLAQKNLSLNLMNYKLLLLYLGIFITTCIAAGIYPAIYLSAINPIKILRGFPGVMSEGGTLRTVLVAAQFSLSIALLIGTGMIFQQNHYIRDKNLGFDKENVVYIPVKDNIGDMYETVRAELLQHSDVRAVAVEYNLEALADYHTNGFMWEGFDSPGQDIVFHISRVGYDYFETMNLEIVEGRSFQRQYGTDTTQACILNEEAIRQMKLESPIGKRFAFIGDDGTLAQHGKMIIGIARDAYLQPLYEQIAPRVYYVMSDDAIAAANENGVILIRTTGNNTPDVVAHTESIWKRHNPITPFEFHFLDQTYENIYWREKRLSTILSGATVIAVLISCLGLLGLVSFMAERRTREIGIRRVLGATVPSIIGLLTRRFIILIALANIIAWPIVYYIMERLLRYYAYRIDIEPWIFLGSAAAVLAIAFLTAGFQAVRAAMASPVTVLRYE